QHVVHRRGELLERSEALDVDRREAVAGVRLLAGPRALPIEHVAVHRAGEHAGEDVDHAPEPVALVAAELAAAPERGEQPRGEHLLGAGGRPPVRVEPPALGDRLLPPTGAWVAVTHARG